jgi:hypothetical protein
VRFIHPPGCRHSTFAFFGFSLNQRRIVNNPAIQGGMIHQRATLLHDFFQVTIRDAISDIEKYSL